MAAEYRADDPARGGSKSLINSLTGCSTSVYLTVLDPVRATCPSSQSRSRGLWGARRPPASVARRSRLS
jgi:hypothetical protein